MELYNDFEKNENGTFKDKEITQSFIQNVMAETSTFKNGSRKYVIQLKNSKNIKNDDFLKGAATLRTKGSSKVDDFSKGAATLRTKGSSKVETKSKRNEIKKNTEEIVEKKIDQMNKTFETMMVQFQHMVQLNQLIQVNQMNQMQIMNQLLELKSNVIETRQDLSYKLKEINGQIDHIKHTQLEQGAKISEINNKRGSNSNNRKSKEMNSENKDETHDYSHLYPLYKENIFTLLQTRDVDMRLVKNILKSKNMSGFIKIFDMLYKSKNVKNIDIYPIRVIKSKTLQYYNEEHNWFIDTNGTNIMNIICSNIVLILSKVNNDFFESGEFDSTLFIDNHNFIQELDDKKIRNQLFSSIKDLIINHNLNYKEETKEILHEQKNKTIENNHTKNEDANTTEDPNINEDANTNQY